MVIRSNTASDNARKRLVLSILVVIGPLAISACSRPLIAPDMPRTQYDRYDAVRNQKAPAYSEDEFGRRTPNLRGRLSPKD